MDKKPLLCSACDPDIKKWHGRFEQRSATGMLVDQEGHLWSNESDLPKQKKILGIVL